MNENMKVDRKPDMKPQSSRVGDAHTAVPKGSAPKTTPMSVMGSQGKSVHIKPMHFMNKPTKVTKFTAK